MQERSKADDVLLPLSRFIVLSDLSEYGVAAYMADEGKKGRVPVFGHQARFGKHSQRGLHP